MNGLQAIGSLHLQDARSYPSLLDSNELDRLVDLGLVRFGPVPFESSFPGALAAKWLVFGDKKIMVTNSKLDATLYLRRFALPSDSHYIIDLYDEPGEILYDHFEADCAKLRNQNFIINDHIAD